MIIYYDVTLINRKRNSKTSYVADSFSVDDNRILKIKSKVYGNLVTKIENDEELSVIELKVNDELDY